MIELSKLPVGLIIHRVTCGHCWGEEEVLGTFFYADSDFNQGGIDNFAKIQPGYEFSFLDYHMVGNQTYSKNYVFLEEAHALDFIRTGDPRHHLRIKIKTPEVKLTIDGKEVSLSSESVQSIIDVANNT